MKLAIISDTHLRHVKIPEADVLIHCGDALLRGVTPRASFVPEVLAVD